MKLTGRRKIQFQSKLEKILLVAKRKRERFMLKVVFKIVLLDIPFYINKNSGSVWTKKKKKVLDLNIGREFRCLF